MEKVLCGRELQAKYNSTNTKNQLKRKKLLFVGFDVICHLQIIQI